MEFPPSKSTSSEDDFVHENDYETNPPTHSVAIDRPRREIRLPPRYAHAYLVAYALTISKVVESFSKPSFYEEAVQSPDAFKWVFKKRWRCKKRWSP